MDGASREEGCSSSNNDNDSKEIPCPLRQNMSCAFFPSLVVDMKTFVWGGSRGGTIGEGPCALSTGPSCVQTTKANSLTPLLLLSWGVLFRTHLIVRSAPFQQQDSARCDPGACREHLLCADPSTCRVNKSSPVYIIPRDFLMYSALCGLPPLHCVTFPHCFHSQVQVRCNLWIDLAVK